ncbi:hypothetical protein Sta7437_4479 [Stanieria cyanosphaera PCC 7437]|uniref:DUF4234 domain-containing protein n=1 Tax=Stanieria cyanosphaera (strain ATCC 29371 / PCC 7437) TaxID=111780 RepID=K9XZI5_STAC7|nr:hypothetical protein [Stanieria cyanosphaera]AFZ37943.1 hypothetical protein Sta7437_4479 [Stanieria cyanosphaera PCC 7437]
MIQTKSSIKTQQFSNVMPIWKFCILYVITYGFYAYAWGHKQWKFLKDRENLNINCWLRSILFPFFMYGLYKKVFVVAEREGYRKKSSAFWGTVFYWSFGVVLLFSHNDLIGILSFLPLLPLLNAANYYWEQEQSHLPINTSFTIREVLWILFGIFSWIGYLVYFSGA